MDLPAEQELAHCCGRSTPLHSLTTRQNVDITLPGCSGRHLQALARYVGNIGGAQQGPASSPQQKDFKFARLVHGVTGLRFDHLWTSRPPDSLPDPSALALTAPAEGERAPSNGVFRISPLLLAAESRAVAEIMRRLDEWRRVSRRANAAPPDPNFFADTARRDLIALMNGCGAHGLGSLLRRDKARRALFAQHVGLVLLSNYLHSPNNYTTRHKMRLLKALGDSACCTCINSFVQLPGPVSAPLPPPPGLPACLSGRGAADAKPAGRSGATRTRETGSHRRASSSVTRCVRSPTTPRRRC